MTAAPKAVVSVFIDDDYWEELDDERRKNIVAWGFVIAGETMPEGKTSGPVFTGNDGGHDKTKHVGSWRAY